MIKPSELRIGNWLLDYYGVQRKVAYVGTTVGIHNDTGGTDKYQNAPIFSNDLEDLHPIPLTPEIMDKLGDRKLVMGDTSQYWSIGGFLYSLNDHFIEKGLHWLQNFHYFRTGAELKYQP